MRNSLVLALIFWCSLCFVATAQAQVPTPITIINGVKLATRFARGEYAEKTVKMMTYRKQQFPAQRAIAEKLPGTKAADQIAFLEAQLDKCYEALQADSTGLVCSANRQALLKATQAIVAKARPLWGHKYYDAEIAFYLAEDARRQQVAALSANK